MFYIYKVVCDVLLCNIYIIDMARLLFIFFVILFLTKYIIVPAPVAYVYEAIVGDLVLQIPCNTTLEGSPVANIKWEYRSGEKVKILSREGNLLKYYKIHVIILK